jgi:hypothetical protein
MIPLAIQSVGALTPVGEDATATLAMINSELRFLCDLPLPQADGQAMTGMIVPIDTSFVGSKRLCELGSRAFYDATRILPDGTQVGLAVCAPSSADEEEFLAQFPAFCTRCAYDTSLTIVPKATRLFPAGRDAIFEAMGFVQTMLRSQAAPFMCLLGIDSLVTRPRLRKLISNGIPAGFIPGEAGAAVLFSEHPNTNSLAVLTGLGAADEPSLTPSPSAPNLGKGLAAAIVKAALDAKLPKVAIAGLVHDLPETSAAREELIWTKGCSVLSVPSKMLTLAPSYFVGEAGAAMGVLSLLALAFLVDKNVVAGPGLCLFSTSGARRGAAVLLPSPYRQQT